MKKSDKAYAKQQALLESERLSDTPPRTELTFK